MTDFARNGFRNWRKALKGKYVSESEAMAGIRMEMLCAPSDRRTDASNRMKDRAAINGDIRRSFNKLILANG